ncbi:sigma-70 family RNA polymerase sigma factor [Pedobacter jeongneungensis]|uniref:sigma-70 family RNA polymerase sigma factor n=1 Tax=Pedobacter jeongneungensis TaxID=947309 RepID=UPI000468CE10|nr:sigma-70 family RNA polymerase sigma factor [Pedobacter jeongneungensis]
MMDRSELEHATTAELIEYIQGKDDFIEAAKCAFENFFLRFENELTKKCRVVAVKWGYDQSVGDIISEQALEKFWLKANRFNPDQCKANNLDRCLLFYIFRIAQRLLCDKNREEKKIGKDYSGDEEIIVEFPSLENLSLPAEKARDIRSRAELIEKALDRLGPKHKIIYLTYQAHERKGMKLPRHLLEKLRDELELTQTSIRIYKKMATDTVTQIMQIYGSK